MINILTLHQNILTLQDKILTHFERKVVRKDLTSRVKGNAVVPAYLLEFLLGQYCAINDEEVINKLITHVENNYNFIELGLKGTGKSHIFSELSPHGVLVSGGDVTSARLFVSNTGKGKIGLVGKFSVTISVISF